MLELHSDGLCEIGAHLHPWVNPPHQEEVNNFNSYPGNLPPALEKAKLAHLTRTIEDRFGFHPTVYKAGRYGVGAATTTTLEELAYEIDTSVVPETDLSPNQGPDFSLCGARPYWFGNRGRLLEIPLSVGFAGLFASAGRRLHDRLVSAAGQRLHLAGLLARLRLIDRITLTPEGIKHHEHRRLTKAMFDAGQRVFSFTYHSPSLAPGNTPYVRNDAELQAFLDRFEAYFDYFFGELGGRPATPGEIRSRMTNPGTATS